MEFRTVTSNEKLAVEKLWRYCFGNEEPYTTWHFSEYYSTENTIGGFIDGQLVCALQLIPYTIQLRGQDINTAYIVGVSTAPEARRKGATSELLKAAFSNMAAKGQFLSLLMPFRAEFYHPFGFAFCYDHIKYNIPLKDLRQLTKKPIHCYQVDSLTESTLKKLQYIYAAFTKKRNGYVIRTAVNWNHLLTEHFGEKGFAYLLENKENPQAYILYVLKEDKILVREMIYTSEDAKKELFSFLYAHSSQVPDLEWNAPSDDLSYLELPDTKLGVSIYPFLMGRIVDVKAALASTKYSNITMSIIIKVHDELVKRNHGCFSLNVVNGKAIVKNCDEIKFDIALDINTLAQLIMGRISAMKLYQLGKIKGDLVKIQVLEDLFPKCNNYINEYF